MKKIIVLNKNYNHLFKNYPDKMEFQGINIWSSTKKIPVFIPKKKVYIGNFNKDLYGKLN